MKLENQQFGPEHMHEEIVALKNRLTKYEEHERDLFEQISALQQQLEHTRAMDARDQEVGA